MKIKERHSVYIGMLRMYKRRVNNDSQYGFCAALWDYMDETLLDEVNMKDLIELMAYKPKTVFYDLIGEIVFDDCQFWFPIEETALRIKILEECIEKTKS